VEDECVTGGDHQIIGGYGQVVGSQPMGGNGQFVSFFYAEQGEDENNPLLDHDT
jgi:hypothetical protein